MYPIYAYGSEEQRKKYLPKLASGEWLGCFGLTEPDFGSNPAGMITNFKDDGNHVILNGAKMWISNAPYSQVAIVWAKDESGEIQGLIVERGMKGFTTPVGTDTSCAHRGSASGPCACRTEPAAPGGNAVHDVEPRTMMLPRT